MCCIPEIMVMLDKTIEILKRVYEKKELKITIPKREMKDLPYLGRKVGLFYRRTNILEL